MSDFPQQLAVQSWILYGIGMAMILLRTLVIPGRDLSPCSLLTTDMRGGIESEV